MSKKNELLTRATVVCVAALFANAATAQAVISLDSVQARVGESVTVPLTIFGSPVSSGFNAEIRVPQSTAITSISGGSLINSGFSLNSNLNQQEARVLAYSSASTFSGDGDLADVQIQIGQDAMPGIYMLEVSAVNPDPLVNSRYALSNTDGLTSLPVSGQNGSIYIYSFSSDFDGDELP
ncbi:MAG: cohesin domain-containing protein, partial [Gammaproteobacteria bacterium]